MNRVRSSALTITAVLAASGGLAACGSSGEKGSGSGEAGKSPQQILADVKHDLAQVKSLHLDGKITNKSGGPTQIAADIDGTGGATLTLGEHGTSVHMIILASAVYMKGDATFWKGQFGSGGGQIVDKLAGRWVAVPASAEKDIRPLLDQFSPKTFAACVDHDLGTISKQGTKTVDGQQTVVLKDAGDKPGAGPGLLYVTTSGPHLPVRIDETGPSKPGGTPSKQCGDDGSDDDSTGGQVTFSNYDKVAKITAPKGALNLQDLQGGAASDQSA
jgi:hypothetical protein